MDTGEVTMLPISKSTFLQFQICPKDTWLRLHKPELVQKFTLTEFDKHLLEQGNEVDSRHGRDFSSNLSGRWLLRKMRRTQAGYRAGNVGPV
jgi:hypothetical protein